MEQFAEAIQDLSLALDHGAADTRIYFMRSRLRERTGDPRLSLEERYPTKEIYVAAVRKAAESLVADRLLLPEDAGRLVAEADTKGVRTGP
jgi:hypothetical protein